MDIFSTHVLSKVVENLPTPSSFLLDTFFPNVQTSEKEEIYFDVTDSKPRITPFVSPLLPGKVVDNKMTREQRADKVYEELFAAKRGGSPTDPQLMENPRSF